jgi:hypothetical protein
LSTERAQYFKDASVAYPGDLYVDKDDIFVIYAWNSSASLKIHAHFMILDVHGNKVHNDVPITLTSDRAVCSGSMSCMTGTLVSAMARIDSGSAKRGQCYVKLCLAKNQSNNEQDMMLLDQGYLTNSSDVGWPRGKMEDAMSGEGYTHTVQVAAPGAGNELVLTVPANAVYNVKAAMIPLVTSSAVANRNVEIVEDDGTNIFFKSPANTVQTASLNWRYNVEQDTQRQGNNNGDLGLSIPLENRLLPGYRLRTITSNMDVGDAYSACWFLVQEWISP